MKLTCSTMLFSILPLLWFGALASPVSNTKDAAEYPNIRLVKKAMINQSWIAVTHPANAEKPVNNAGDSVKKHS
ncbi:hypothetical protein CPC08DRAFT_823656 [Agrocybe pediades]|nr:hypothetical protein CPC08DRAFT_823656 [Agrocybe pediades]